MFSLCFCKAPIVDVSSHIYGHREFVLLPRLRPSSCWKLLERPSVKSLLQTLKGSSPPPLCSPQGRRFTRCCSTPTSESLDLEKWLRFFKLKYSFLSLTFQKFYLLARNLFSEAVVKTRNPCLIVLSKSLQKQLCTILNYSLPGSLLITQVP